MFFTKHFDIDKLVWPYLLLWFIFIATCSQLAPYFANDYRYMLIEGTDDLVGSFSDVLISQYRHYFDWGGRSVAHVIAQTLLLIGKPGKSIITAACYIVAILFIYYNAYGVKPTTKLSFKSIFFISIILFISTRAYGEVVFNVVSSSNYLFTTTLILIFILPFRLSIKDGKSQDSFIFAILMFFVGILAGWCNENTSAAIVACVGLLNLYHIKRRTLTYWQFTGGIGLLIGFVILALSPGNEARMAFMENKGFDYIAHLPITLKLVALSIGIQFILLISFIVTFFKVKVHMFYLNDSYHYYGSLFLFAIGLLSALVMLASPNIPARTFTAFTFFVCSATVGLYIFLQKKDLPILTEKLSRTCIYLSLIYCVLVMPNVIYGHYEAYKNDRARKVEIYDQLNENKEHLVVSPFFVQTSKYLYIADVRTNEKYYTNQILKRFYKVDSIVRSCDYKTSVIPHDFKFFTFVDGSVCK